jgi:hypothetical protein
LSGARDYEVRGVLDGGELRRDVRSDSIVIRNELVQG